HAVGAEDHGGAVGHLVQLLHEHGAAVLELVDHVAVVDHFVAHVDRRAQAIEGTLDDLDRAVDAGTEAAGVGEDDVHGGIVARWIARKARSYGWRGLRSRRPNRTMPMAPPTI